MTQPNGSTEETRHAPAARWWRIYYESREYARVMGDPLLGYVWAPSKAAAEAAAEAARLGGVAGVWAVPGPVDAPAPELVHVAREVES